MGIQNQKDAAGKYERYKARLVAKGLPNQGINYYDTWAPSQNLLLSSPTCHRRAERMAY